MNKLIQKYLAIIILIVISINVILSIVMINTSKKDDLNNTCDSIRVGRIIGYVLMALSAIALWSQHQAQSNILIPVITLIVNTLLVKATYDDEKEGTCHSKTWLKYLGYLNAAQAILVAGLYLWFSSLMKKIEA